MSASDKEKVAEVIGLLRQLAPYMPVVKAITLSDAQSQIDVSADLIRKQMEQLKDKKTASVIFDADPMARHLPPANGQDRDDGSYWHRRFLTIQAQLKVTQEELCHLQKDEPVTSQE